MKFPKAVRIAGRQWAIRRRRTSTLVDCVGLCHYDKGVIDVALSQTPFDTRDTTLHEVLHAILLNAGFQRSTDEEERYVLALATGLTGVLQDNPEFAKWLIQPITKKSPS